MGGFTVIDPIPVFAKEPQLFFPITILSALLLGAGVFLVFRTAAALRRRAITLDWISDSIASLDRCRIANWAEVRRLVPRLEEPGLNRGLDRIETDSEDLYHGLWIPSPAPFLKMRDVLPTKDLWLFSKEALVLPPAAGLISSCIAFLLGSSLGSSLVPDHYFELAVLCALPTVLGLLLLIAYVLTFGGASTRVHAALGGLSRAIARRVPVFSESTGMAALIDTFLQYDRQMGAAVAFLDQHVESLASGALAKAVSQASERAMRTTVAPAIAEASATMARVAEQVDRNQQEGMKALAAHFAEALQKDFRTQFAPVAERLESTAALLVKAEKDFSATLDVVKKQRDDVVALAQEMGRAQAALQKERAGFLAEIAHVSTDLNTLTEAADRMSRLYEGTESHLSGSIDGMTGAMDKLAERVETTLGHAAEESRRTSEQAAAALEANQAHLDEMRKQIQVLSDELANRIDQIIIGFGSVTGETLTGFKQTMDTQNENFEANVKQLLTTMEDESRSMSLYAKEIDVDLTELNATLKGSVAGFNEEMLAEVKKTLGAFDEGLAEIVKRLSVASAEIGDAVEALPQALRGIGGGAPR